MPHSCNRRSIPGRWSGTLTDVVRIASFVQKKDYIRSMDETLIPQNPKPLMQNPWFCCRVGVGVCCCCMPRFLVYPRRCCCCCCYAEREEHVQQPRACRVDSALGSLTRNGKEEIFSSLWCLPHLLSFFFLFLWWVCFYLCSHLVFVLLLSPELSLVSSGVLLCLCVCVFFVPSGYRILLGFVWQDCLCGIFRAGILFEVCFLWKVRVRWRRWLDVCAPPAL